MKANQAGESVCNGHSAPAGEAQTLEHSIRFSSELSHCAPAAAQILEQVRRHGYSDEEQFALELALDEALTNAVRHGNCHDQEKQVRVEFSVTAAEIRIRISDEGPGFDPQAVPDPCSPEGIRRPGGRGVMLMSHYMCGVQYNGRGNCVEMWKRRKDTR